MHSFILFFFFFKSEWKETAYVLNATKQTDMLIKTNTFGECNALQNDSFKNHCTSVEILLYMLVNCKHYAHYTSNRKYTV